MNSFSTCLLMFGVLFAGATRQGHLGLPQTQPKPLEDDQFLSKVGSKGGASTQTKNMASTNDDPVRPYNNEDKFTKGYPDDGMGRGKERKAKMTEAQRKKAEKNLAAHNERLAKAKAKEKKEKGEHEEVADKAEEEEKHKVVAAEKHEEVADKAEEEEEHKV